MCGLWSEGHGLVTLTRFLARHAAAYGRGDDHNTLAAFEILLETATRRGMAVIPGLVSDLITERRLRLPRGLATAIRHLRQAGQEDEERVRALILERLDGRENPRFRHETGRLVHGLAQGLDGILAEELGRWWQAERGPWLGSLN